MKKCPRCPKLQKNKIKHNNNNSERKSSKITSILKMFNIGSSRKTTL